MNDRLRNCGSLDHAPGFEVSINDSTHYHR
jgi:hypothetical protein